MKYTGELFGVQYLYDQTGEKLSLDEQFLDKEIDDGFVDDDEINEKDVLDVEMKIGDMDYSDADLDEDDDEDDVDDDEIEEVRLDAERTEDEGCDARGIPGWNKVEKLATVLADLDGLSVCNQKASQIKELYDDLDDYDKRPITFKTRPVKPQRGRFGRQKRSGHVTLEAMKRCFITAGAPASSPSLSRVVEAVCIRLCEKYPTSRTQASDYRGRSLYTSRWRLVVSAYNSVRARVMNSESLEDVPIQLFHINEKTLAAWFKDSVRRDEVTTLLKGLQVPRPVQVSNKRLPAANTRPTVLPSPSEGIEIHEFPSQEDRSGQAPTRTEVMPTNEQPLQQQSQQQQPVTTSRTTEWRRRKEMAEGKEPKTKAPRKVYGCRVCNQPMTSPGHTQYKGKRYCPNVEGQIPKEEWLALRKAEDKAKSSG